MNNGVERSGYEETIVKKGTFEQSVNKEIEGVPNEEDAQAAGSGGR